MKKSLMVYALTGLVGILVLLLVFGIVLGMGWPWWVGVFLAVLFAGLGLAGVAVRGVMRRKKEQHFVSQIIEQDNAYLKSLKDDERRHASELQDKWKEAVDALKRSHLKKQGNPLYVLPWYMVLGESGSGKTTSIQSARLSSPFAEVNRISGISGTKNCDWWFFEQAVIIDTAGRYAIPVDEGRDKDEWQKFISLLARYRKKEPLNGLVVTVSADKILQSTPEVLQEDGRNIRLRVDELMRALGSKFPVYVLVTKCDLVQGMTQFTGSLSEAARQQAMGMINHTGKADPVSFVKNAMHTISERLRNIRLIQLHKADPRHLEPELLLFPEEFSKLEEGLAPFMKAAFQENPYQESPLLRGIYFSSGRQEGSPYSHFLKNLGLIEERDVLPGTNKGLFLHDFFATILPRERHLFAPTRQAVEWSRLTRNLGLLSWLAFGIAVCGLLSFSFVKNLAIIRSVPKEPPVLTREFTADVNILEQYRAGILKIEEGNRHWWIPRFGLTHSRDIEGGLKRNYCRLVEEGMVTGMNEGIEHDLGLLAGEVPDTAYARYVMHLIRRINLAEAHRGGAPLEELSAMPRPSILPFTPVPGGDDPALAKVLSDIYLYRVAWDDQRQTSEKELHDLRSWLKRALEIKGPDFRWVAVWVDSGTSLSGPALKDFWGGSLEMTGEPSVPAAFTLEGKGRIDAVFAEISAALGDTRAVDAGMPAFQDWYRRSCLAAWEGFARSFARGSERLRGKAEWEQAAARMPTREGPYFVFLDRMKHELEPYAGTDAVPAWLAFAGGISDIADQARAMGTVDAAGSGSLITKVTGAGSRIKDKVAAIGDSGAVASRTGALRSYAAYLAALKEASAAMKSSRQAIFQLAADTFSEGASAPSPFVKAKDALGGFRKSGPAGLDKDMWLLAEGPIRFVWEYACREAACHLQDLWIKDVFVLVQGIPDPMQANAMIGGGQGAYNRFMRGPAAPFLNRDLRGYAPRELLGVRVPFDPEFLGYSSKMDRPVQSSYRVTITGLPTNSNSDASVKPHSTRIELGCGSEMVTLENFNYPVRKVIDYAPQSCGTTVFTIEIGDVVLTRQYEGGLGFPEFLSDFPSGRHTFTPADFPGQKAALKRMGIRYIRVNYRFDGGHKQVAELFTQRPGRTPESIAACWAQ